MKQGPEPMDVREPKYPTPKILLIDLDCETETTLKEEGYNVSTGSFGIPYKVERSDGYEPVLWAGSLPSTFAEHEIVVVDLEIREVLETPSGDRVTTAGENDWWAKCSSGVIDPRPRTAVAVQNSFDRILSFGGTFIIFAAPPYEQEMVWARVTGGGFRTGFAIKDKIPDDAWRFLSILERLDVKDEQGEEVSLEDWTAEYPLGRCLSEYVADSQFSCILFPQRYFTEDRWFPMATSKYGDTVAGAIVPDEREESRDKQSGWVFILPQLRDKAGFLRKFLKDVLLDLAPQLFPFVEGSRWVQRPEYELPEILESRQQIEDIREETKQRIESLEKAIEEERNRTGYLHELLQCTGRPLVLAVQTTLKTLGFQAVVDVDAEAEEGGETRPKREDLQIHDDSLVVLVEVKGISQLPKDADALQVWKYIAPRMREWGRTDIRGLSIVNHQRHIPAVERENVAPFRGDLLTNAEEHDFGLLTTWDLFRLIRSFSKNHWKPEYVKPLFYRNGRIEPVPIHYEYVGSVEHFWPNAAAVGVRVEAAPLNQGDRIAFELPVEFEEQAVESLQVDREPVESASPGQLAGIATHLTKEQARKGVRVFRVRD